MNIKQREPYVQLLLQTWEVQVHSFRINVIVKMVFQGNCYNIQGSNSFFYDER